VQQSRAKFHPETLRRIRTGERVSGAEYVLKRRELERMRREAQKIFKSCDLVVTPTTPIPPPPIAELEQNPQQLRPIELLMLRNTRPFNVLGLPAISVLCGFTREGMPIGLQLTGPPGGDALVLRTAHAFQERTDWHRKASTD
jgi:Asp-tRNA(Asn)/Glu-tRNA(Gln) amidotransferase A subunit family amidase